MMNRYTTVFIRKQFTIENIDNLDQLTVNIDYDDGFVVWINGNEVAKVNVLNNYAYDSGATGSHEFGEIERFVFDKNDINLINGKNIIAVQGFNVGRNSSDFYLGLKLEGKKFLPVTEGSVTCDIPSGFYKNPFTVKLTADSPGETIKYTLDGSDPKTALNVLTGNSPVSVLIDPGSTTGGRGKTGGVVLRAAKYQEGFAPGIATSRSYIFTAAVKNQTEHPGGSWPTNNVNGQTIDLPMDTKVTLDNRYKNLIENSLLDIPTISVTTDPGNLFNSQTGIYVNAENHGSEWERPANIELINPDGSPGFNIDAGIRIRGGWSRHDGYPKHAFRLFFRKDYGEGKLEFPLFGNEGTNEFDKVDLRTSQNYSWSNGGDQSRYNTMNRDVFRAIARKTCTSLTHAADITI
ncbi:MAG: chitobiase/beta-hexosaminidase C-terminal domain-containing protein [Draconibacterium sp.]|nr:chitobiase/beta-hexosaminidase C-terminal domain-containing protein [Draconibacterium sp.]